MPFFSPTGGGSALPSITGTTASPQTITAVGGVAFSGTEANNVWFVQGPTADTDVEVTANPQIAAGVLIGQSLTLIGRSDSARLIFEDGTGLALKGAMVIGLQSVIQLIWDGTVWVEQGRNE